MKTMNSEIAILRYEADEEFMSNEEREKFLKENKVGCGKSLFLIFGAIALIIILFLFFFLADKLGF